MIKKAKKTNSKNSQINTGVLVLENKKVFKGIGIGYQGEATGEVCFNTSLTGYQEIISDPSYAGQIINFTFPHIGNVGTNKQDYESDKIWTKGVIFNSEITSPSNYRSFQHLDAWLKKNKIVGITGLDTRSLTNFIRDKGAPKGTIANSKNGKFNISKLTNSTTKWSGLKNLDLAEKVTTSKNYIWKGFTTWKKETGYKKNNKNSFHVVAIDYGIKKNILRYFSDFNCKVTVVSCKTPADKILAIKPNGIFLSNGPGDPAATGKYAIKIVKDLINKNLPLFGICLGHQILALALGGKTKKMKLGHRGANHPVKNLIHDNVEITSQNHGFEVVKENLPKNIQITHKSLFDNSIEGIRIKNKPVFSVQYHPESNPGPQDSVYLFQEFINNMKKMPKRRDLKKILVVGAGPIIIGQACEFDYSGTQACKALRDEGYKVVLINSNPATIMTDPDVADKTYIEPITLEVLEKILKKEKPDAILPTMGGQTALNLAMEAEKKGILKKYKIELIGANSKAISNAEDRKKFRKNMIDIGLDLPKSEIVNNINQASKVLNKIGLPAIIRPAFTLGGLGGGIAKNKKDYLKIIKSGLHESPVSQVLVEECLEGWKEFEMEVVRDKKDNCIIICSIENIDPMGIHTGDSVTVAPALTLTDKEYQVMRNASIACLRKIGVETGGSNVQFAINPKNGRMVVIEMNPRVSRSSALASKATGFPIAKVAAKLAVGYTLDELKNEITKVTPASFEPSIDYVVTKIPRFTFEKFSTSPATLGTSMKSVGEAMAIGRNFKESLQKALVSLETGFSGLDRIFNLNKKEIEKKLIENIPNKILLIAEAIRKKINLKRIFALSKIDPWFLEQIKEIVDNETMIKNKGLPKDFNEFNRIKSIGFSDKKLSELTNTSEDAVRRKRMALKILPVFKKVDTCAAEFKSFTPYMYSTYQRNFSINSECEADPSSRKKIVILGGGPNRIGQGIEFDYCCCQASFSLKDAGFETIMVNCNPETVSTDYDTSDRLYFEPLKEEYVFNIIKREKENGSLIGIIAQFGGQTPIKLAKFLHNNKLPILGTQYTSIDLAEDRDRFRNLLNKLNLKQAESGIAKTFKQAIQIAEKIGLPLMVRPSYVLGGRAMEIVHEKSQLKNFVEEAFKAAEKNPILIDKFIDHAMEVDVDAISDGKQVHVAGIMQHIEEAGIHSGDSACSLPPVSIKPFLIKEIENQTKKLALALKVKGFMNIQFAIKKDEIYVIEVNPRASRTVPFVSKAKGLPLAKIASRVMAGEKLSKFNLKDKSKGMYAVKEAVFPFNKFPNSDLLLGPEMKSTGEVMGFDKNFGMAFAKSQIASANSLPKQGLAFISLKDSHKDEGIDLAKELMKLNFTLCATRGTAEYIRKHGMKCKIINKVSSGSPHIVDVLDSKKIALVINTGGGNTEHRLNDAIALRRGTLKNKVPYCTNMSTAQACLEAIKSLKTKKLEVTSLQDI